MTGKDYSVTIHNKLDNTGVKRGAEEQARTFEQMGRKVTAFDEQQNKARLTSAQKYTRDHTRTLEDGARKAAAGVEKQFKTIDRPLTEAFKRGEKSAQEFRDNVNRKLQGIGANIPGLTTISKIGGYASGLFGGSSGGGGGFLPGLANISSIIRGIPQIGQLAHALVSPLTEATEAGVRFNAWMEGSKIGFARLLGGKEQADALLKSLERLADRTPFQFEDLVSGTKKMLAFGFAAKDVEHVLTAVGDALSATDNLSGEALDGVIRQLGQIISKGRLSAEEMESIADRGIPAWELLAKAIGKTVAETRKLSEQGRLKGRESVEAILAMIEQDPRFRGAMAAQQGTLNQRLSNLEDIRTRAEGLATEGLTRNLSEVVGAALQRGDLVTTLAGGINKLLTPVSGLVMTAAKGLLGGGLTSGLVEGIKAGKDAVTTQLGDLVIDGLIGTAKKWLGIESPSKEFHEIGLNIATGLRDGFVEGMDSLVLPAVQNSIEAMITRAQTAAMSPGQRTSFRSLQRLTQREPEFLPKLVRESQRRGINPDDLLNLMALETAHTFSPAKTNPWGYTGLIQFGSSAARDLGTSTSALRVMTATQQLDYVFRYLEQHLRGIIGNGPVSGAQLYEAVGAGSASADPNTVRFRQGTTGFARNQAWNFNRDDKIQAWEFGAVLPQHLGAGQLFSVLDAGFNTAGEASAGLGTALDLGRDAVTEYTRTLTDAEAYFRNKYRLRGQDTSAQDGGSIPVSRTIEGGTTSAGDIFGSFTPDLVVRVGNVSDQLITIKDTSQSITTAFQQTNAEADKLGAGEWADRVIADAEKTDKEFTKLAQTISGVFGDAFEAALTHGPLEGFRTLRREFASMVISMARDWFESKLFKSLTGQATGQSAGGGIGAAISGLFSRIFGGGAAPTTAPFNPNALPVGAHRSALDLAAMTSGITGGNLSAPVSATGQAAQQSGLRGLLSGIFGGGSSAAGASPFSSASLTAALPLLAATVSISTWASAIQGQVSPTHALLGGGLLGFGLALIGQSRLRRQEETRRDALATDARAQIYQLIADVRSGRVAPGQAGAAYIAIIDAYRQSAMQLRDKKTREHALAQVDDFTRDLLPLLRREVEAAKARASISQQLHPTYSFNAGGSVLRGFADGGALSSMFQHNPLGYVQGAGNSRSDSITAYFPAARRVARVSNTEYVLDAETVRNIGVENLDRIRARRGLAEGGAVASVPGAPAYTPPAQSTQPPVVNFTGTILVTLGPETAVQFLEAAVKQPRGQDLIGKAAAADAQWRPSRLPAVIQTELQRAGVLPRR